jgi:hypothetical protein
VDPSAVDAGTRLRAHHIDDFRYLAEPLAAFG